MFNRAENKKYHYFYKITNKINNHFYYGVHNTDNLDDGYMGSGKRLLYAYNKYGEWNFKKEILKFFDTSEEAFEYEAQIVTEELVKDNDCYNCILGGVYIDTTGFKAVKDNDGNVFLVDTNDKRCLTGELSSVLSGMVVVKNKNNEFFRVKIDDERYQSGELVGINKGRLMVKDSHGNVFMTETNDPRLICGELTFYWTGKKHKEVSKQKIGESMKKSGAQKSEKNSQYGTRWINKGGINKKINKNEPIEPYLKEGWKPGRFISKEQIKIMRSSIKVHGGQDTKWIYNDDLKKSTYVKSDVVDGYLNNGWKLGRKYYK